MEKFIFQVAAPESAAGLEQVESANDIGMDKISGARDGAVDVRFRREMHDMRDGMFLDDAGDGRFVAQIDLFKSVFGILVDSLEVDQMTGIGQTIQVDELV